jgi:hypothetical protein
LVLRGSQHAVSYPQQPHLCKDVLQQQRQQTTSACRPSHTSALNHVLLLFLLLLQAAQIFRKMVEVVNHCHELGVMHRCLAHTDH